MKLKLNIWRQGYGATDGAFETYDTSTTNFKVSITFCKWKV